jgi:hypothetical protein
MDIPPIPIPRVDAELPVRAVPGVVIADEELLDAPELRERVKHFQAPFPM